MTRLIYKAKKVGMCKAKFFIALYAGKKHHLQ